MKILLAPDHQFYPAYFSLCPEVLKKQIEAKDFNLILDRVILTYQVFL